VEGIIVVRSWWLPFKGRAIGKRRPYKKWAFTLKQKRGTLEGFVNSCGLEEDMIEIGRVPAGAGAAFAGVIPGGWRTRILAAPDDDIVLGAVVGGRPVGALIASLSGEADVLVDVLYLYAAEAFRRIGVATRLVDALALALPAGGADGIRFVFSGGPGAREFCLAGGAEPRLLPGGVFRTTLGVVAAETFFASKIRETDSEIYLPLPAVAAAELAGFFTGQDMRASLFPVETFLPESRVIFAEGKVVGLAAVSGGIGGLDFFWLGCDKHFAVLLPGLIKNVFASLKASFPAETPVTISAITPAPEKLVLRLVPGAERMPQYEAAASLLRWKIEAEARAALRLMGL
jgi:GNAT superfamily N-acetyltransferase